MQYVDFRINGHFEMTNFKGRSEEPVPQLKAIYKSATQLLIHKNQKSQHPVWQDWEELPPSIAATQNGYYTRLGLSIKLL